MNNSLKGIRFADLLSKAANAVLNATRSRVVDGWSEISAAPGEISFAVLLKDGQVFRVNGVLASGGSGQLLKAAFRDPEDGSWLDATKNTRSYEIRKLRKTMRYLSVPDVGTGVVPPDAPLETRLSTLKIRWTPSGRVLYSVDGAKFSVEQPIVHLDRNDVVTKWLDRAMIEIGKDMKMSSAEFSRWCNYRDLPQEKFDELYHPERYTPAQVEDAEVRATQHLEKVEGLIERESSPTHASNLPKLEAFDMQDTAPELVYAAVTAAEVDRLVDDLRDEDTGM